MANLGKKIVTGGATLGVIVASLLMIFGVSLFLAIPVWLLWNWLIPTIFGITEVTLLQAWGLSFLSGLLFRSASVSNDLLN